MESAMLYECRMDKPNTGSIYGLPHFSQVSLLTETLLHAWKDRVRKGIYSWLQSAISLFDGTKSYEMNL